MRHLNGRQAADADGIASLFFDEFIIELYDTPNAAAEQTIELCRILFTDRNILLPEIGKLRLIAIFFDIEPNRHLIDDRITPALTQNGKHLLCLVGPHKVIGKDALDRFHAFLDNGRIVRTAILPQQKFQNIDGDICPLFDLLREIFPNDLPVEILPQLVFQDRPFVVGFGVFDHTLTPC